LVLRKRRDLDELAALIDDNAQQDCALLVSRSAWAG
jgi:hypothetical protein